MANTTSARSWWWGEFEPIVRLLSATIIIGAASGAVIGGLGGRLAMGPARHERPITPNMEYATLWSTDAKSPVPRAFSTCSPRVLCAGEREIWAW